MKKNTALIFTLLFCSIITFGQQKNEFNLINIDSTWGQEALRFPARNMNYRGIGEVRFPPEGWINPEHKNFWSYIYAWDINVNRKITEKELALDLVKYFNSLNHVDMEDKKNKHYTSANVTKIKQNKSTTFFNGKVNIFDRFATNKRITLNVLIESLFCKKEKKTIILFKFSPKEFEHETWDTTLKKISLYNTLCNE